MLALRRNIQFVCFIVETQKGFVGDADGLFAFVAAPVGDDEASAVGTNVAIKFGTLLLAIHQIALVALGLAEHRVYSVEILKWPSIALAHADLKSDFDDLLLFVLAQISGIIDALVTAFECSEG